MGKRGPQKKAKVLDDLHGNPADKKRPEESATWHDGWVLADAYDNADEIREQFPVPDSLLRHANKAGAEEYKQLIVNLYNIGLVTAYDTRLLEAYCLNLSDYHQAHEEMARDGQTITNTRGDIVNHPAWKRSQDAMTQIIRHQRELGFTPAGRAELIASVAHEKKQTDKLEDMMMKAIEKKKGGPKTRAPKTKPKKRGVQDIQALADKNALQESDSKNIV